MSMSSGPREVRSPLDKEVRLMFHSSAASKQNFHRLYQMKCKGGPNLVLRGMTSSKSARLPNGVVCLVLFEVCWLLLPRALLPICSPRQLGMYSLCPYLPYILDLVKVKQEFFWSNILIKIWNPIISNIYNVNILFIMILIISLLYCRCLYIFIYLVTIYKI
jgi:hypothetical protein